MPAAVPLDALLHIRDILTSTEAFAIVIAASLTTHIVLKRIEPIVTYALIAQLLAIPAFLSLVTRPHFVTLPATALATYAVYFSTLVVSVVTYRLSPFHPLAKYPGPLIARVTKFWSIYISNTGKQHVYLKDLHDRYGDFVRVGPNEISVRTVSAVDIMMGPKGLPKGPFYDARRVDGHPPSLLFAKGAEHARHRKPWSRAFNTAALKNYEELIVKRATQFSAALEQRQGGIIDISVWLEYFVFDFMGDFIFGGVFEMMRDGGDKDGLWHKVEAGLRASALFSHIPWAKKFTFSRSKDIGALRSWTRSEAKNRREKGSTIKDLYYYLTGEDGSPDALTAAESTIDGGLAIIAGSDTTTFVLSNLVFYLMSYPDTMRRLREEIEEVFPDSELPFDVTRLARMKYLNAVIDETMRLQPPVASGSQRTVSVGTGGVEMAGCFLPEGTHTFVPTYALQRDPRNFSPAPETFWPDRWLPDAARHTSLRSEPYVHNTSAFIPFSFGPTSCVGKNLALQEMRMVTALLVQKFDFEFAKGYDPTEWEEHLVDFYVRGRGNLPVRMKARY